MKLRFALPPKSMWLPVLTIVLVGVIVYAKATQYTPTSNLINRGRAFLGV
jgi:hypothetical protein